MTLAPLRIPIENVRDRRDATANPRLALGNCGTGRGIQRCRYTASGLPFGRHLLLTLERLRGLAKVIRQTAQQFSQGSRQTSGSAGASYSQEVVPNSRNSRGAVREVRARHGLEYQHDLVHPVVYNQVYAVLPGPYGSVATWPWTKRLPAREEATELAKGNPRRFPSRSSKPRPRVVVNNLYGKFSVLIWQRANRGPSDSLASGPRGIGSGPLLEQRHSILRQSSSVGRTPAQCGRRHREQRHLFRPPRAGSQVQSLGKGPLPAD